MHYIKILKNFILDIYKNRFVIIQLVKRDFKNRYIGSTLGFIWTILQPLAMLFVLWFVFAKGFRSAPISGQIPYIAWVVAGFIAWNFFAEALSSSTNVFVEYSYLIKKMKFKTIILPTIKILSSLLSHCIFIGIGIIILLVSGLHPSWWWLQIIYYLVSMLCFLFGISLITSSLQVFIKDTLQVVTIFLQFGFWLTPVMWNFDTLPAKYQFYFKFNPIFYIVDGYRRSFIYHEFFWQRQWLTVYFWSVTLIIIVVGILLFRRLRPHFADVL